MWTLYILSFIIQGIIFRKIGINGYFKNAIKTSELEVFASFLLIIQILVTIFLIGIYLP